MGETDEKANWTREDFEKERREANKRRWEEK
jgi:hypothetical protein